MQALRAGIAAVDWGGHCVNAWNWAQVQSASAYAILLALPTSCTLAALHTGGVCTGMMPVYVATPGFAPLSYSWGWLLVGIVTGAVLAVLTLVTMGRVRREPTITQLGALMQPATTASLTQLPVRAQARADALHYIAVAGQPALQELAEGARMTELAFMTHLLAINASSPPGLASNSSTFHY